MFTELVGNFEASSARELSVVELKPSALLRAQAMGLVQTPQADRSVDVYDCSCCGSGCNCSASSTWGCGGSRKNGEGLPSERGLLAATLAA